MISSVAFSHELSKGTKAMKSMFTFPLWLLIPLYLCDCTGPSDHSREGIVHVQAKTQGLSVNEIDRVMLTISGPNISPAIEQDLLEDGQWLNFIGQVPVGANRTFMVQAFNAQSIVIYKGHVHHITVTENEQVVMVLLQQIKPPDSFSNTVPEITGVTFSTLTPQASQTISLQAFAQDPDISDTITYTWTAAAGLFDNPSNRSTNWTAPSTTGTYTLTLTVRDNRSGQVTANFEVQVQ